MAKRVILEVKAKPGTGDELVAFFRSILPETRAHEGCTSVDALQNSDDADNVVLVEVWESREQHETTWPGSGRGVPATGSKGPSPNRRSSGTST